MEQCLPVNIMYVLISMHSLTGKYQVGARGTGGGGIVISDHSAQTKHERYNLHAQKRLLTTPCSQASITEAVPNTKTSSMYDELISYIQ